MKTYESRAHGLLIFDNENEIDFVGLVSLVAFVCFSTRGNIQKEMSHFLAKSTAEWKQIKLKLFDKRKMFIGNFSRFFYLFVVYSMLA